MGRVERTSRHVVTLRVKACGYVVATCSPVYCMISRRSDDLNHSKQAQLLRIQSKPPHPPYRAARLLIPPPGDARSVIFFGSMKAVLPGKPQSRLQGLASGYWDARHINVGATTTPTPTLAKCVSPHRHTSPVALSQSSMDPTGSSRQSTMTTRSPWKPSPSTKPRAR